MKILAFAASNSRQSINKQLLTFAKQKIESQASLMHSHQVELLDLNDYEMAIYSSDRENETGIPQLAHQLKDKIAQADAIIISFAEHNGSYSAAFKNVFDWTSRIDAKVYQQKPMLMLATSPGPGGAKNVLNTAVTSAPYFAGDVKAHLSIASFYDVFDSEAGKLKDNEIEKELEAALASLLEGTE